jgi:hypothetical protein
LLPLGDEAESQGLIGEAILQARTKYHKKIGRCRYDQFKFPVIGESESANEYDAKMTLADELISSRMKSSNRKLMQRQILLDVGQSLFAFSHLSGLDRSANRGVEFAHAYFWIDSATGQGR